MIRPRYALARKKATDLLQEAKIVAPPVPVEKLAKLKGAVVRYRALPGTNEWLAVQVEGDRSGHNRCQRA